MKTVLILKGLPASGKSTYAKKLIEKKFNSWKRINKDDLRKMFDNSQWGKGSEKFILKVRDRLILEALGAGKHVIVDDTNLLPQHEENIRNLVKGKAKIEVKFFDIDIKTCIARDLKRENSVGKDVIIKMYTQFLQPKASIYLPPKNKPKAVIFDIDGTLATMVNRGPFDWQKVDTDLVKVPVKNVLDLYKKSGYKIIIFTGRDGECEQLTKDWLVKNSIHFDLLRIRLEGNIEKDSVIKKRMFEEISSEYQVESVYDDRDQVVEMWRSLGLQCFQVDYGDF